MRRTEDQALASRLPQKQAKTKVFATKVPLDYAGSHVDVGQVFTLAAQPLDQKLLNNGYVEPLLDGTPLSKCSKCHAEFVAQMGTKAVHENKCGKTAPPDPPRPLIPCAFDGTLVAGLDGPRFECGATFTDSDAAKVHARGHLLQVGALAAEWQQQQR